MRLKFSVFIHNVGSCSDRYCPSYGPAFSTDQLLDRIASIPEITGVDLVATQDLMEEASSLAAKIKAHDLTTVSIATDIFAQEKWKKGSFSNPDPTVRADAVAHGKEVMDLTEELGSDLLTIWPGQDGHDYLFESDYIAAREWFIQGIRELCDYKPKMRVGIEYKIKEPRTHSLVSTVGTTLLMTQATERQNCEVILDYGHSLMGYENPAESLAILQQFGNGPGHIHINDNYRLWDDDMIVGSVRTLEFVEFFVWLERIKYNGWLTIDQYPYREDGRDAVAESALWVNALEKIATSVDTTELQRVLDAHDGVESSRFMRSLLVGPA